MNQKLGYYLGRFQPFCLHHLEKVTQMLTAYPDTALRIGVAGWRGERTQSNFLTGKEAAHVIGLTLREYTLQDMVGVEVVNLYPNRTIEESIGGLLSVKERVSVFSGSEKTLGALERLVERGVPIDIHDLGDNEIEGSPRATIVRKSIMDGTDLWKEMVATSTHEYLMQFQERLRNLPEGGVKRPWSTEGRTSFGLERR
jgi:hypothetical protein